MTAPTVSVIIPAYRAAATVGRAVESLLAQTRVPDEIIVVDDGSPDDTAAAVVRFGGRVRLIRKPNGGAASARNAGIDAASSEWVAFLDADDYWSPDKLEKQLAVVALHSGVGLVGARWYEQMPGGPRVPAVIEGDASRVNRLMSPAGPEAFYVAMCLWTTTVLVRRSVIGTHRFVSGLEPAEDRDLWVRLVASTPVYLLGEPLATYVQEPNSLSRGNVDRDCGNMLRVVRRHAGVLGRRGVRGQEAVVFRRWAAGHLGNGDANAARRPAWRRLWRQPWSAQAWWVVAKATLASTRRQPSPRRVDDRRQAADAANSTLSNLAR